MGYKKQLNEEPQIKKKVKKWSLIENQTEAAYLKALVFKSRAPLSPATDAAYIHALICQKICNPLHSLVAYKVVYNGNIYALQNSIKALGIKI